MNLDPLPPSTDEYWRGADLNREVVGEKKECEHYFVHKTSDEVECRACRIGFMLGIGWSVVDGKLKTPDGFVIGLLGNKLA